jgi:hypothetical protein
MTTRLGLYGGPRRSRGAAASVASAMLGGKVSFNQVELIAGGEITTITLSNDTWVAAGTGPIGSTADTQALIDGFDAASSPATAWNDEIRDKEVVGAVVRTSDTLATITWTASPLYEIVANEVVTLTIPVATLTGGEVIIGDPLINVTSPDNDGNNLFIIISGTQH